jgi:hypothetical protein
MSYKFCEGCKWNIVDTVQICTNPKIQRSECPVITDYKVDLQGRLKFNAEEYTCKYYEPHLESNPEREGAGMSEQIDKSTQAWLKEIGAESPDAELEKRIAELEREVQDYKEENVKLLQTLLALHRAVKRANCELDKIEESCDNNVWFSQLKEMTY